MNHESMVLFEMASQCKFRYPYKGMITTEDLWDLSLEQLDEVFKALNDEISEKKSDSLLKTIAVEDAVKVNELKNKLEIVKYIFQSKEAAAELESMARENANKRKRILAALAAKQESALQNMSEEELLQALNELG